MSHGHHDEHSGHSCSCCTGSQRAALAALSRREFMLSVGATAAIGATAGTKEAAGAADAPAAARPKIAPATDVVVQPVLTYFVPQRREQTSWRPWGGIQTQAQAAEEVRRIEQELRALVTANGLAVKVLPVAEARNAQDAGRIAQTPCDIMLVYASGGGRDTIEALVSPERPSLFFLRHNPGPVSLWYEIIHPHMLRKATDDYKQPGVDVNDVVVDDIAELAWKLRALAALRKTRGQRIVAVGGAGGWGQGHQLAPPFARERWQLDIRDVSYDDLGKRIRSLRKDSAAVEAARRDAAAYLAQPNVRSEIDTKPVENAFVLTRAFKDLLKENDARAMTIQHCMGTVMPISETTACLPLSLLNDEGYLASASRTSSSSRPAC